jgi:membrane-bound lytic murein transglycosylase A
MWNFADMECVPLLLPRLRTLLALAAVAGLFGCAGWYAPPPGIGQEVAWSRLPGWEQDRHAAAWPALRKSCEKLGARDAQGRASVPHRDVPMPRAQDAQARPVADVVWGDLCLAARALETPDDAAARKFFETHFRAYRVNPEHGRDGLITGYYEPLLYGSSTRSERFRWPLYKRPDDLLVVDLASLYPELKGRPVRGRLEGKRVVPYYSRAEIGNGKNPLAGYELLWVEDPVELFILQVQGSGRVRLPDGGEVAVGYADQNGHPYRSLGGRLIELGALTREEVTLTRIRDWLAAHPEEIGALLNSNPSYIFFTQRDASLAGPLGSLGVALTPERSVAVDPVYIPLGLPVWLDTVLPDGRPLQRLALAQDTGGAIKGPVRADLFLGQGAEAGRLAGEMKQRGRLYVLLPKPPQPASALSLR